jgi:hypothetical protein
LRKIRSKQDSVDLTDAKTASNMILKKNSSITRLKESNKKIEDTYIESEEDFEDDQNFADELTRYQFTFRHSVK